MSQPSFQEFLAQDGVSIPLSGFLINLLLATVLSALLAFLYVRFGRTLSDRKALSRNFVLITLTTMLVISIVKSSLALSLGLVGALSIVRFRAAIKEPEELCFIFVAIAIGLGIGADQRLVTGVALVFFSVVIYVNSLFRQTHDEHNMHLTISSTAPESLTLGSMVEILSRHCSELELRRYDQNDQGLEALFLAKMDDFDTLTQSITDLKAEHEHLSFTFLKS